MKILLEERKAGHGKIRHFVALLQKLRFEGKLKRGENVRELAALLDSFERDLKKHSSIEETRLFPFMEKHFPRLHHFMRVLKLEHSDLLRGLRALENDLRRLQSRRADGPDGDSLEKFREKGVYWACLWQNHLSTEEDHIYGVVENELRPEERKKVRKILSLW